MTRGRMDMYEPGPLRPGGKWYASASIWGDTFHFTFQPREFFNPLGPQVHFDLEADDLLGSLACPTCYVAWHDYSTSDGQRVHRYALVVSAWCFYAVAGAFGLYPAVAFIRGPLRRWRHGRYRRRRGLCSRCGYDLTGNVSGICPECGRPIVQSLLPTSENAG